MYIGCSEGILIKILNEKTVSDFFVDVRPFYNGWKITLVVRQGSNLGSFLFNIFLLNL